MRALRLISATLTISIGMAGALAAQDKAETKPKPDKKDTKKNAAIKPLPTKRPSLEQQHQAMAFFGLPKDLGLTLDQRQQIWDVYVDLVPQMSDLKGQATNLNQQNRQYAFQEGLGGRAGRGKQIKAPPNARAPVARDMPGYDRKMKETDKEMGKLSGEARERIAAILTDKQKAKLGWQDPPPAAEKPDRKGKPDSAKKSKKAN